MRILMLAAVALSISSACLLYGLSYDTRLLQARVRAQEQAIDLAHRDIAVLKAERAHLGRPARIAPLARAQGLGPASEHQLTGSPAAALASVLAETRRRSASVVQGN